MRENSGQNGYAEDSRVDELLNSFIDGELTTAEQEQVERIAAQDAGIAGRLRQLQKCKMLVGALPRVDIPAEVTQEIEVSVRQHALRGTQSSRRHVLMRRVLAAAAMIGLVAVLAGIIFTIVTPQTLHDGLVATDAAKPGPGIPAATAFGGTLELKTSSLPEVSAFISTAMEEDRVPYASSPTGREGRRVYSLKCSRKDLDSLLAKLETVWPELEAATLFVDTQEFGKQVAVSDVKTDQIAQIAWQDNPQTRERLAKNLDALNTMEASVPGRQIASAIQGEGKNLVREWVPRPVETGKVGATSKAASQAEQDKTVRLTIIVDW